MQNPAATRVAPLGLVSAKASSIIAPKTMTISMIKRRSMRSDNRPTGNTPSAEPMTIAEVK